MRESGLLHRVLGLKMTAALRILVTSRILGLSPFDSLVLRSEYSTVPVSAVAEGEGLVWSGAMEN
jgi:hypothetical protein